MSKYHWTLDYALWEVSYVNITMLQLDEYATVEEKKTSSRSTLSKSNPKKESTTKRSNLSYGELISLLGNTVK